MNKEEKVRCVKCNVEYTKKNGKEYDGNNYCWVCWLKRYGEI